jgi:hypothetical protein
MLFKVVSQLVRYETAMIGVQGTVAGAPQARNACTEAFECSKGGVQKIFLLFMREQAVRPENGQPCCSTKLPATQ